MLDRSKASTTIEEVFLEALTPEGTLPKQGVRDVLDAISKSLQPKVWRADQDATRHAQSALSERTWRDLARTPASMKRASLGP